MLSRWATLLQLPKVWTGLLVVGVITTIGLQPMAMFGTFLLITSFLSDAPDRFIMFGWSALGTGGLCGLIAAWVRLLTPRARFQHSAVLRQTVVAGLSVGLFIAAPIAVTEIMRWPFSPMGWLAALSLLFGIFLLGATLGERPHAL